MAVLDGCGRDLQKRQEKPHFWQDGGIGNAGIRCGRERQDLEKDVKSDKEMEITNVYMESDAPDLRECLALFLLEKEYGLDYKLRMNDLHV